MTDITSYRTSTICAVSTPAGVGGIAVIRISGPEALKTVNKIWRGKSPDTWASHTAHLGEIVDPDRGNEVLDQAVATVFKAPHSFTGEDVVELSVHGSRWVQAETVNLLIRQGCQLAEAGEFTRRAFANGRLDLAKAEAIADVIASTSRAANRIAINQMRGAISNRLTSLRDSLLQLASLLELELDFSEEDVEFADRSQLLSIATQTLTTINNMACSFAAGNAIRSGVPVAIIGEPNVGKSSLLNALVGDNRAIVSDIPGTTRDTVEDTITIGDIAFRFIDTAGLRKTADHVERLGIERALDSAAKASIILRVTSATNPKSNAFNNIEAAPGAIIINVINKTDLLTSTPALGSQDASCVTKHPQPQRPNDTIAVSALTGNGIPALQQALVEAANALMPENSEHSDTIIITNARHYQALVSAAQALERTITGLKQDLPGDLVAQDLRETLHHLGTITGTITTPDILATIFSRFCIGK